MRNQIRNQIENNSRDCHDFQVLRAEIVFTVSFSKIKDQVTQNTQRFTS